MELKGGDQTMNLRRIAYYHEKAAAFRVDPQRRPKRFLRLLAYRDALIKKLAAEGYQMEASN